MESTLDRLYRRVRLMVAVGSTTTPPNDAGPVQTVQVRVSSAEVIDAVPVMTLFGQDGALPVGSQVLVLFLGGDRSQGVVIGSNSPPNRRRGRKPGETGLHNAFGMALAMLESGVVLEGGGKPLTIRGAPLVTVEGNLSVTGQVFSGDGGGVSLSRHTHPVSGSKTGTPPGGDSSP